MLLYFKQSCYNEWTFKFSKKAWYVRWDDRTMQELGRARFLLRTLFDGKNGTESQRLTCFVSKLVRTRTWALLWGWQGGATRIRGSRHSTRGKQDRYRSHRWVDIDQFTYWRGRRSSRINKIRSISRLRCCRCLGNSICTIVMWFWSTSIIFSLVDGVKKGWKHAVSGENVPWLGWRCWASKADDKWKMCVPYIWITKHTNPLVTGANQSTNDVSSGFENLKAME